MNENETNGQFVRPDGRAYDELRPVKVTKNFTKYAPGSVLIESGDTRVICTAMTEERVPPFLRGQGKGWVSAEYSMLPSSTDTRKIRDRSKGKIDGRSSEIQRLIGRSLRSAVDLEKLGERTIWIDCDVIQADGGTRTASITGAYIALQDAIRELLDQGLIEENPVSDNVAAVSVGIREGVPILDLCYLEDSGAEVDMNVVMNSKGEMIEIQGTGEERPFTKDEFAQLMTLAEKGIAELTEIQQANTKQEDA
ncbi:MAG: ribonuclease PH [Eubacteriaceae bacterium]|jgi:ribonuclease PH